MFCAISALVVPPKGSTSVLSVILTCNFSATVNYDYYIFNYPGLITHENYHAKEHVSQFCVKLAITKRQFDNEFKQ